MEVSYKSLLRPLQPLPVSPLPTGNRAELRTVYQTLFSIILLGWSLFCGLGSTVYRLSAIEILAALVTTATTATIKSHLSML